jgi:hypothetical protein
MAQVLIVGCGNPLRGDDGLAWRAADDHVLMTGSASLAFTGDIDLGKLENVP